MGVAFGGRAAGTVLKAVRDGIEGFESLAVAVSYVQLSGWELLRPIIAGKANQVRLVCTDQLGITDPAAVRAMQAAGVAVHAYTGAKTYHPKIFIASGGHQPDRWVLGSANLSRSALQSGVEAVFSATDDEGEASEWFEKLFNEESEPFDDARLSKLEAAFAARIKGNLTAVQAQESVAPSSSTDTAAAETIEAAFASLPNIVVPLNADKAGNNVRTLKRIKEVLDNPSQLKGKALSEFKLMGFAKDGFLTPMGLNSKGKSREQIARNWMGWLKHASTADVQLANPCGMLARAKIAFETFWAFPKRVRDFYLENATKPTREVRPTLQVIELLANTGRRIPNLTVEDITTLSSMLNSTSHLPLRQRAIVQDYLDNKGTRGWSEPDRVFLLKAWRDA
jgi:HKD family nuclease